MTEFEDIMIFNGNMIIINKVEDFLLLNNRIDMSPIFITDKEIGKYTTISLPENGCKSGDTTESEYTTSDDESITTDCSSINSSSIDDGDDEIAGKCITSEGENIFISESESDGDTTDSEYTDSE